MISDVPTDGKKNWPSDKANHVCSVSYIYCKHRHFNQCMCLLSVLLL